jgi:phosphocarrier protein FPr
MVEVPSAVWLANELAGRVNFFSIGTNDLTQNSFAADRTDASVAYLNEDMHPVVLRQIDAVVKAAHRHHAEVGVCGELAGRREAIPLLIGLNVDELSMAPAAIPAAKRIVRRSVALDAAKLAEQCLGLADAAPVAQASRQFLDRLEAK